MGGSRKRLKQSKGKRWRKGHSSESNPTIKKYRETAKSRFFNVNTGPSDLTVDALAKHDAKTDDLIEDMAIDTQSVSAKTFNTWATNWTDCTNNTFKRVHRYWTSNSAMHKEILAVLAAVTEVIKQQGGTECETAYFGALMTTLDVVDEEMSIAAVVYLLSLAIKRTPAAVLQNQFQDSATRLLDILVKHSSSDTPSLLRSTIQCLAQLLRMQDSASWNLSSTMDIYKGLLAFVTHAKPKVRRAAQEAVCAVLKTAPMVLSMSVAHHPAAAPTATYCSEQIESLGGDSTTALHVLGLFQHILALLPQASLKAACETVLRTLTLSSPMVTSVSLKALHGMFVNSPSSKSLPPAINAQIITALYNFQPGEQDTQPLTAWLSVMQVAHTHLAKNDVQLCVSHLPRLVSVVMKCMLHKECAGVSSDTLTGLFQHCLSSAPLQQLVSASRSSAIHKLAQSLETGLSYQYHAAWAEVFQAIRAFIQVVGSECPAVPVGLLSSVADLRDSHNFPHRGAVDSVVGCAVRTMGPRAVLGAVPLGISGEEDNYDFPRSWLLPVIRDNVCQTQLSYFTDYFLPLAAKLRTVSLEYEMAGRKVEAKSYDTLQGQIWSMLPGFCTQPTDLPKAFPSLARILGTALQDRADLRLEMLASIRRLIQHAMQHDESRVVMRNFAKNFLPILLNLFTIEPAKGERDSSRLAVLDTAKVYFELVEQETTSSFFGKCCSKMQESDVTAFRRHALMDLCIVMIHYIDTPRLLQVYPVITASFSDADKTIQKKSYRLLEQICTSSSDSCKALISAKLPDLQQHLLHSLSSSSPSSKAPRLRCLIHILGQLDVKHADFLNAVVPEAILCTKEVAEKARSAAYNLVVAVGTTMQRWHGADERMEDVVRRYFEMLMAGLAGSPHMIACTILALTKAAYEFKASVDSALLAVLIDGACLLLKSKAREIVHSAIGLIKVLLAIFPESSLAQFLQQIVSSLVTMKEDSKHHFRFKNKEIYTRLIRKFGYEVILKMVPESHHKILVNIKKTTERTKRQKKQVEEEEESNDDDDAEYVSAKGKTKEETLDELLRDTDSELEEEQEEKKKRVKRTSKTKGAAWIKENSGDIVDFLDPNVNKKVLATRPDNAAAASTTVKHNFKTASDGRMIITEDSDDDDGGQTKKKQSVKNKTKKESLDDMEEDLEDLLDTFGGGKKPNRKRKVAALDVDDDDTDALYKPGGKGIHRPLSAKRKKDVEIGGEYKSKKAKGDVKKKDKHDPYAYIPLTVSNLNKRKRAKAKGQFRNLVKSARKGAAKGSKMRSKNK